MARSRQKKKSNFYVSAPPRDKNLLGGFRRKLSSFFSRNRTKKNVKNTKKKLTTPRQMLKFARRRDWRN
jgi:hypothetical protein